ncbi:hypothetical protein [Streptomyces microflavus]|uniref:hypothetical protein n=1 Tax=Streptomyces microflavus TaxID=1919 RepID=UPI003F4C8245
MPTTLAAHRFWTIEDPEERAAQRIQFLKNASTLGGLLIAAADTHGKPSLAYRTRHTVGHASDAVTHQAHAAADRVGDAAGSAVDCVTDAVEAALKQLR